MKLYVILWVVMSLGWVGSLSAASESLGVLDHAVWDQLLRRYVVPLRDGQASEVDYAGFLTERESLDAYLADLSRVSQTAFDAWPIADQLAFLINAYNAATVSLVITRYPNLTSIKQLGSYFQSPWRRPFVVLLEQLRSLDDIEHHLIRGSQRYQEPRIHFAVNCASVSCPALRPEAFQGAQLEAQLERATQLFLQDRTRNRVQGVPGIEDNELQVSKIFKWYRADFEAGWRETYSLVDFFVRYANALSLMPAQVRALQQSELPIQFLDYDWDLNHKR